MSTLEALDELYSMGFIMDEEYQTRRAALGAPPKETAVSDPHGKYTVSNHPVSYDTPAVEPYQMHFPPPTDEPRLVNDFQDVNIGGSPFYPPPQRVEENPYPEPTYTGGYDGYQNQSPYPPPQMTRSEEVLKSPLDTTDATPNLSNTPDRYPDSSESRDANGETRKPIEIDLKSFEQLHISPTEDTSNLTAFKEIPPGKVAVIQRDKSGYFVHYVDEAVPLTFLQSIGCGDCELQEVGQWKLDRKQEMYWTEEQFVAPNNAQSFTAGKIYLIRESKTAKSGFTFPTNFDPRPFWEFARKQLESTPKSGGVDGMAEFNGDKRIPDLRMFSDLPKPCDFDPRIVFNFLASKVKVEEVIAPGPSRLRKIKTTSTPAHMHWPLFTNLLRALQVHMPEELTYALPSSSVAIWARIQRCISDGVCYITGEPATTNSFLCSRLHTEEIWNAYTQIQRLKEEQNTETYSTEPDSRSYYQPREEDERIVYTESAKKRSYGWPTREDLESTPMKTSVGGIKPVSAIRQGCVASLTSELASLGGPSPLMEA